MRRFWGRLAAALLVGGCALPPTIPTSELAATGTFRVAINYGNVVLAKRSANAGPQGVSVDLAREAAQQAGVPLQLVEFQSPAQAFDALRARRVDAAFLAVDSVRAEHVDYTPPYVQIQAAYLVRSESPLRSTADVDKPGIRIALGLNSGYDLYLTRTLKSATLVRQPPGSSSVDAMIQRKADVAAGLRQQMLQAARARPGLRVLDGDFMLIDHAMAVPRGNAKARHWLAMFLEEAKQSGFVAAALARHRSEGARVASHN